MTFWQEVQQASGMGAVFVWAVVIFVVIALSLLVFQPAERLRLRTALILFAISLVGLFVIATMATEGVSHDARLYLWFRWASLFCLWIAILNIAGVVVFEVFLKTLRLRPTRIMRDLLVAVAYVVVGISLLSIPRVDITGIVATSAVLTAVIGLSFQDTLGNMMGGMALQMERAICVGDWIRIDGHEGMVMEIRWRHTSIETRNWDTMVIPNSLLAKTKVCVLGRRSGWPLQHRQWVYFHVPLSHAPTHVIEAVETALRAEPIPCVAANPEPHCLLIDIKSGEGTYAARYWLTDFAQPDPTDSLVRTRIYASLQRDGIALSLPTQSILLTEEKSQREQAETAELQHRLEALKKNDLFHSLTESEQQELAAQLVSAPFVKGEAMTRQGAQAHWLYMITEGEAEVRVTIEGVSQKVGTLHSGDYFGEMGLMTGQPRTSTVIATTDVKCYRLGRDEFQAIVRRRPEIAEAVSLTLAHRRIGLDIAREEGTEEALRERMQQAHGILVRRIQRFFGIGEDAT